MNGQCEYKKDGVDTDGTIWWRCLTHDELALSPQAPCAGYEEIPYKQTSAKWYELLGKHYIIHNPDGWDRKNYDYSFNQEEITEAEYNRRVMASTILDESQFGTWTTQ